MSAGSGKGRAGVHAGVRLVHDHQVGRGPQEVVPMPIGLDIVGGDHGDGEALEDGLVQPALALQAADGAREHQLGLEVELGGHLPLPLLGQVRGAEHGQPLDLTTVQQFAGHQAGLDGLADAHVVGDQQAHRIQFERHHQGHQLVGPGLGGDAAEGPERPGGGPGGKPRRVPQQHARGEVAQVPPSWQPEGGRGHGLHRRHDAGGLFVQARDGLHQQELVRGIRLDDPLASAGVNHGSRGGMSGDGGSRTINRIRGHRPGSPKMSGWSRKTWFQSSLWWKRITM